MNCYIHKTNYLFPAGNADAKAQQPVAKDADETQPLTNPTEIAEAVAVHAAHPPNHTHDDGKLSDQFEANTGTHSGESEPKVGGSKVDQQRIYTNNSQD